MIWTNVARYVRRGRRGWSNHNIIYINSITGKIGEVQTYEWSCQAVTCGVRHARTRGYEINSFVWRFTRTPESSLPTTVNIIYNHVVVGPRTFNSGYSIDEDEGVLLSFGDAIFFTPYDMAARIYNIIISPSRSTLLPPVSRLSDDIILSSNIIIQYKTILNIIYIEIIIIIIRTAWYYIIIYHCNIAQPPPSSSIVVCADHIIL